MTTAITVTGDVSRIERALKQSPTLARRAALSAINRTLAIAQTAGVRDLARAKALPVRVVKSRTKIVKAKISQLAGRLVTLTAGFPVDRLKYRSGKKGLFVPGHSFPHAFEVAGKGAAGRPLVFERRIIGGRRAGRLPIERVKIELNPEADRIFKARTDAAAARDLPRIFERDFAFRLSKAR